MSRNTAVAARRTDTERIRFDGVEVIHHAQHHQEMETRALAVVQAFYSFWATADPAHLDGVIHPAFTDHHHAGRAPGVTGLTDAATAFHATVPGFGIELDRVILACPFITVQGRGVQTLYPDNGRLGVTRTLFNFTDVLRLSVDCRITDNWPLEGSNAVTNPMTAMREP